MFADTSLPWWQRWWVWFGVYFALVILKRWQFDMNAVWWVCGGLITAVFDVVDRLVYVYVNRPHEQLSEQVKLLITERRYTDALRVLYARKDEQLHLASRSVLFLGAWVVLALFVLTSSVSWLAKGMVMGIGLRVVYEIVLHWNNLPLLQQRIFWQVKREIDFSEVRAVVSVFMGLFLVLSLLV